VREEARFEFDALHAGTEPAGTGEYENFLPEYGYFACRVCKSPLYSALAKFHSGCGWPAFDKCFKGAVNTSVDESTGQTRTEITCGKCGAHLGHVFEGEHMTETNERHCVNSLSLMYVHDFTNKLEEPLLKKQ
jgi:peptide-methionine (R)-S-oxide reductase